MGDVDRGVAVFVVQPANFETHLLAQIGVEVGQAARRAAAFPARRSARAPAPRAAAVRPTIRRDNAARGFRVWSSARMASSFLRDGVAIDFPQPQAIDDIFGDRHVRPQRVALEDHRHLALLGRQRPRLRGHQRGRRHGSRRRRVRESRRSAAASWSCRSRTGRAGRPAARGRSAARHYRPPQAIQIAWSGRANQRTPITSLPKFARIARRCRPLIYRWINISTNIRSP